MPNTKKVIGAGAKYAFYGVLDANGILLGGSKSLSAGNQDGSAMPRFEGIKTAPITVAEPEVVTATGDDEPLAQFTFEPTTLPEGVLETAVKDLTFEALCLGLEVFAEGEIDMVAMGNPKDPDRNDMCLILQQRAKSWAAGTKGASRWEGIIIPKCTITPLGNDAFTERAVSTVRYQVTVTKSDMLPYGLTLGASLWGTEEQGFIQFTADNPIRIHAWRGDGVQTVFNFSESPISAAKCNVYVDGIKQIITTHYTIDPTAKTITFVTAPGNNVLFHALYEFAA